MTTQAQDIAESLELVNDLVAKIGAAYKNAGRYRRLAPTCETRYLGPALTISSALRRIIRSDEPRRVEIEGQIARLRELLAECEAAIDEVRASDLYRRTHLAWQEGDGEYLSHALPEIFSSVAAERPNAPLYYPIQLRNPRAEKREGHFTPAIALAERIALLARDGIPAESSGNGLGTDELIRAVPLGDDPESIESPVAVRIAPEALRAVAVCRVDLADDLLAYTPRLSAGVEVHCAPEAGDEWWAIRPDAYREYVLELRDALAARGIACRTGA